MVIIFGLKEIQDAFNHGALDLSGDVTFFYLYKIAAQNKDELSLNKGKCNSFLSPTANFLHP